MSDSTQAELRSRKPHGKEENPNSPISDKAEAKDKVVTQEKDEEEKEEKLQKQPQQVPTERNGFVRRSSLYAFSIVCALSVITRFWKIWSPDEVVFDEVHFGKFASYYLRREYYFDVHPPLAKMLIALGGFLIGYRGQFLFDTIGLKYVEHGVPYVLLRSWVCLFGAALPPMAYMIMAESGYSCYFSLIAALFVVFDNSLIVHSRLILLDNMMIFFGMASVLCYIKFYKCRYAEFSVQWKLWLCMTGLMLGCVLSCKMVGLFTFIMIGSAVVFDLWRLLDIRRGRTIREVASHFMARFSALIVLPLIVYLTMFYVHFAILTKSGPGDAYHTSKFQMQLEGNILAADTPALSYGAGVTFQHQGTGAFLSTRDEKYPLRYEDGRVSSQGQQVTGVKEVNGNSSYWVIHPVSNITEYNEFVMKKQRNEVVSKAEADRWKLHNGDEIRLYHVDTTSYLRTHDVASPLTSTNMEFTTAHFNVTQAFNDTIFEIHIDGEKSKKKGIYPWSSFLRIVSKDHRVSMYTHEQALPEWGYGDQEINGNKNIKGKDTTWTIQHVMGRDLIAESSNKKKSIRKLWFFEKFFELQFLMLKHNSMLTKPHPYQSAPHTWPFMRRGVSYWTKNEGQKQIYMMGNPFGWWLSGFAILMLGGFSFAIAFAKRRGISGFDPLVLRHMSRSALFIASGWFFHYLPFFFMGRSLFLHHYLPSAIFGYMIIGVVLQCLFINDYRRYAIMNWSSPARAFFVSAPGTLVSLALLGLHIAVFLLFSPITYGTTGLETDKLKSMKWFSTWDFQFSR